MDMQAYYDVYVLRNICTHHSHDIVQVLPKVSFIIHRMVTENSATENFPKQTADGMRVLL